MKKYHFIFVALLVEVFLFFLLYFYPKFVLITNSNFLNRVYDAFENNISGHYVTSLTFYVVPIIFYIL